MSTIATPAKPWYRQFWPWFLIALPATVVVASLTNVFIAFKHADAIVVDNYYQEGRAINVSLALDNRARELGLTANVAFDRVTGEISAVVSGDAPLPAALTLLLFHPADAALDQTLILTASSDGRYRGDLDTVPAPRYHLRLQSLEVPQWRLSGKVDFRHGEQVSLLPLGGG